VVSGASATATLVVGDVDHPRITKQQSRVLGGGHAAAAMSVFRQSRGGAYMKLCKIDIYRSVE